MDAIQSPGLTMVFKSLKDNIVKCGGVSKNLLLKILRL